MMTRRLRSRRRPEGGQALVEFARAWNLHQVMTDAAREGARRMVLNDQTSGWDEARHAMWDQLAQFGYDPTYADMSYNEENYKLTGEPLTVTLSLPYKFAVLGQLSFTMRTSFTMRNE